MTAPATPPASGASVPDVGGHRAFWAGAAALALIPTAALAAVIQLAIP